MNKKPTKKEIDEELQHLRHLETCFLTLYVSLMLTGLTLYLSLDGLGTYVKGVLLMMFLFSMGLFIIHIWAITFNDITNRINAFITDVAYFSFLILAFFDVWISTIFVSINILLSFIILLIIFFIGMIWIAYYISKVVIPTFRKKIFPKLSYHKNFDNPMVNK